MMVYIPLSRKNLKTLFSSANQKKDCTHKTKIKQTYLNLKILFLSTNQNKDCTDKKE
jgi:hypothetical protein